jgi:hypothetical protein
MKSSASKEINLCLGAQEMPEDVKTRIQENGAYRWREIGLTNQLAILFIGVATSDPTSN